MKNNLYHWVWRWHFIGGLISLPIVALLSITGIIYLFKADYEYPMRQSMKQIEVSDTPLSFQTQWKIVESYWDKPPTGLVIPKTAGEATEFISGRFSHKSSLFIDPYSGEIKGIIQQNKTDMHQIRKLHGELLLGTYGTKVVELVASWMVVLILTGVYLFWPRERGWKGLFTIRFNMSRRITFRDLHGVSGFWFSILLLLILAGGLPWTDIWGTGFKWVQAQTDTGFPREWHGRAFTSHVTAHPISLDEMVMKAKELNLTGEVSISLPHEETAVYTISNTTHDLSTTVVYHFDRYSGEELSHSTWEDIGMMMKGRLWVMAFHQGQFGTWNWGLVLFTAVGLLFMSITALFSYLKRKKRGEWAIPREAAKQIRVKWVVISTVLLSIFLPAFGLSVCAILLGGNIKKRLSDGLS